MNNIHNYRKYIDTFRNIPRNGHACKYSKPLHKTQHSEILVEYEQGFDRNTGKSIKHPMAIHHSTSDENSYIPVNLLKTQETLVEK